jgi:hypothetical protein
MIALALGSAAPAAARAQDAPSAAPARSFCFSGARRPECGTFLVTELQGNAPLGQTSRTLESYDGTVMEKQLFEKQVQWEIGVLHNVSDDWALGASTRVGSGTPHVITAATARARRWLSDDLAVEASAGATFRTVESTVSLGTGIGLVTDARLNFRDDVHVGLRFEQIPLAAQTGPEGRFDEGGDQRALSLLVGLGSEWGLGGTALLGLGAAALAIFVSAAGVS